MNLTRLSLASKLDRDATSSAMKAILRCLGENIKQGNKVMLDMQVAIYSFNSDFPAQFGKLTIAKDGYILRFQSDFKQV